MMRKESYVAVEISALNRLALVCDEERNASYIFDTEKLAQISRPGGNQSIVHKTKDELNALIKANPGVGVRFVYSPQWTERVRHFLNEPIPSRTKDDGESDVDVGLKVREVSKSEFDPWRGFWTSPEGKHYGEPIRLANVLRVKYPILNIARGLSISIKMMAKELSLRGEKVQGFTSEHEAYAIEDVEQLIEEIFGKDRPEKDA